MKAEYFKQLDALRAYAVFGVIFGHIPLFAVDKSGVLAIFYSYLPGVPVFFCISGFLITLIILRNVKTDRPGHFLKSFYARRFLRIFPIYYLTIAALYIANIPEYRDWFVYDLFYVSNIKMAIQGSFDGVPSAHFWSLAVEEQFYLLWPFLFILFRKVGHFWLIIFFIVLGFSLTVFIGDYFFAARTFTPLCFLGLGGLMAYLHLNNRSFLLKVDRYSAIVAGLFILVILLEYFGVVKFGYLLHLGVSMIITTFLVLRFVVGFKQQMIQAVLEHKVIVYLGKISYGLYVYHLFTLYPTVLILNWLNIDLASTPAVMQGLKIALTIVIAAFSWEFFEKRLNRLKRHFNYSKS